MKTTGVVRRIDDLGRIVIPKEIRKTLRIKDGESLEIFLDSDHIVLKKYSYLENIADFYKNYVEAIYSSIKANIMIIDCDQIVAASGEYKKKYLNQVISSYLENIIQSRSSVTEKDFVEFKITDTSSEQVSFSVSPIIANGDAIGAVVMLSKSHNMDELDEKTAQIAAKFLGKYIE